jgi:hypothetical protein
MVALSTDDTPLLANHGCAIYDFWKPIFLNVSFRQRVVKFGLTCPCEGANIADVSAIHFVIVNDGLRYQADKK